MEYKLLPSRDDDEQSVIDNVEHLQNSGRWTDRPFCLLMLGIFVGAVIAGIFIGIAFRPEEEPEVIDELTNYEIYENAAIATDAANCSFIGNEMLKQNGSAVDAAIAALLCVGLHNCHSTGIGGGNFMVIHMKRWGVTEVIDARETAPLNSTYDMFSNHPDEDASTTGGLAIAVPGELHGMWTAHQRWGLIPWDKLFEPTIELAANGFVVGAPLAKAIRQYNDTILADEGLSEYFVGDDGEILKEGDICVMKKLAATLQLIADRGAMEFYSGVTAEAVVADIQERGGIITSQDLLNYEAKKKAPLELRMGDSIMYTPSPPASGAVLSFILNILEGYHFDNKTMAMDNVTTYHRITEAFKHAFAHRTGLGDEDYEDTVSDLVDLMMSKEYAAEIRERIHDNTTHDIDYYYSSFSLVEDHGTAHLSVVDQRGNSVSVTSTINTYFGSKVVGSRTGIIFNNEMDDFSSPNTTNFFEVPPSPVNFIEPGKRPLSSMDPAIVVNGQGNVSLSIGGSGGTLITTAVSLSTMNLFWFGLNLGDAILQPRIHHQLSPNELDHEEEFSDVILAGLREKNHVTSSYDRRDSVVQAIHLVDDQLHACSDDRKGGLPAGF